MTKTKHIDRMQASVRLEEAETALKHWARSYGKTVSINAGERLLDAARDFERAEADFKQANR